MSRDGELAHLLRVMKMPAAARALPKLAEPARQEDWSYERFLQALLSTETASRESSGGRLRIRAARCWSATRSATSRSTRKPRA
jgi:hypothetical protein